MAHRKFTKADDLSGNDVPQSVGPHTSGDIHESTVLQVFEPHRGRDLYYNNPKFNSGSTEIQEELDNRIPLGTYTLNNRGTWEENNFNESTLQPYLTEKYDEGAPGYSPNIQGKAYKPETWGSRTVNTVDGDIVIPFIAGGAGDYTESNTGKFSVEALPFVINPNNDDIIHLDRYYDKSISGTISSDSETTNKEAYELATEGKINLKLEVKKYGRVHPSNPLAGAQTYNASQEAYFDNFGMNIDIFSNRYSSGTYIDNSVEYEQENDGIYLFKLNWDDGTALEHTSKPKLLEDTVLFEHHYEKPGFYSITGVVYRIQDKHLKTWEKFQTNILLNPSPNYELNLHDYNNFASIGGISKDSAFVKSLYNMVGISPLPISGAYDTVKAKEEVIEKLNTLDKIQILNILGKVDYSLIEPYYNFLSPYQTPTDDQDSYAFGCPVEWANNYYFLDNPPLPEGTQLIDDGTCFYLWPVTIQLRVVDGLNGNIIENATVPYFEHFNPAQLFPKFVIDGLLINESTDSTLRSWGDDLQEQIQDNNEFVVLLSGQGSMHTFSAPDLWGMGPSSDENVGEREVSMLHFDWYFDGWYENGVKIGSDTLSNHQFNTATTLEARFYYQDTVPPQPIRHNLPANQYHNYHLMYNYEEFYNPNYSNQTTIPYDSLVILFDDPAVSTESMVEFEYNDIDYFKIDRIYYDYILGYDIEEEIAQIPFDTEKVVQRMPNNLNFSRYKYIDENLPYRDYGYRITTVDTSGLESEPVESDTYISRKFPTPSDQEPDPLDSNLQSIEQIKNNQIQYTWQQITEVWPGLEGNFKHFSIGVTSEWGDIDTGFNFLGDYDTGSPETHDNRIPTEFIFEPQFQGYLDSVEGGLSYKQWGLGGDASSGFYPELVIQPITFKISVVATAVDSNALQTSAATIPIEITPTNYVSAHIEVGGLGDGGESYFEIESGYAYYEQIGTYNDQPGQLNRLTSTFDYGYSGDDTGLDPAGIQDIFTIAQVGDVIRLSDTADGLNDRDYTITHMSDQYGYLYTEPTLPSPLVIQYVNGIPYTGEFQLMRPFAGARTDILWTQADYDAAVDAASAGNFMTGYPMVFTGGYPVPDESAIGTPNPNANSGTIALSVYAYPDGELYLPVPIRFFINTINDTPPADRRLFIRAFKKGSEVNGVNGSYSRDHLGMGKDVNYSMADGEWQYVENYEISLSYPELGYALGENIYIGVYDGNDTNILTVDPLGGAHSETQPFQIQEVYGCTDVNSDNHMDLATVDFNCRYSFNIVVQSLLSEDAVVPYTMRGAMGVMKMEFIELPDGSIADDQAQPWGSNDGWVIEHHSGYPPTGLNATYYDTVNTENTIRTNRDFLLVSAYNRQGEFEANQQDYIPAFVRWEIQEIIDANNDPVDTVKLEFTDDVSWNTTTGNAEIGLNPSSPQGWTTNLDDLDFSTRGGSAALLAIRPAPNENGNSVPGPDNYLDKLINAYWIGPLQGGTDIETIDIIGSLGWNLILPPTIDVDENVYGEEDDEGIIQYPRFPIDVEMRGTPFTFEEGEDFAGQSPFGFIGPQHFTLMKNTINNYGSWQSHKDHWEEDWEVDPPDPAAPDYDRDNWMYDQTIDLSTRVIQMTSSGDFVHDEIEYAPSFNHWQVIEGHTWLADGGNWTGYDYVGGIWNANEDPDDIATKVHGTTTGNYPLDEGGTYIFRDDEDENYTVEQLSKLTIKVDYDGLIPYWNDEASSNDFESVYNEYVEEHGHRPKIVIEATYFEEGDSPSCFLKGTMIRMTDDRQLPIQDIQVGMEVMSYDDQTNSIAHNKVTKVFHHPSEETESYLVINGNIRVTNEHLMYVNKLWSRADNIKVGDYLYNNELNKVEVTSVEKVNESVETYNFEVENTHTYFVENIIVHNEKGGPG